MLINANVETVYSGMISECGHCKYLHGVQVLKSLPVATVASGFRVRKL